MRFQTFNCYVSHATEASQTVVCVKCTTNGWEPIVVTKKQPIQRHLWQPNAPAQPKKGRAVKKEQPTQAVDAIFTNKLVSMSKSILFAIDESTEEIIVSDSPKGTNTIAFVERIGRHENQELYNAVVTLTSITQSAHFDVSIFKAMDKVCQLIYAKHAESK